MAQVTRPKTMEGVCFLEWLGMLIKAAHSIGRDEVGDEGVDGDDGPTQPTGAVASSRSLRFSDVDPGSFVYEL